jgi:hypothetical protein
MREANVKTRSLIIAVLMIALLIPVCLPQKPVHAQSSVFISDPGIVTAGGQFTVTIGIYPNVTIQNALFVNVSYSAGLTFAGHQSHVAMSGGDSLGNVGSGSFTFGVMGGSASAGNLLSVTFTAPSAGTYTISTSNADYGVEGAVAFGSSRSVTVQAAAPPPTAAPTLPPTAAPTLPPTAAPTAAPTQATTARPATTSTTAAFTTAASAATAAETEPEPPSLLTVDETPLFPAAGEIPAELGLFDYELDAVLIGGTTIQTLRAEGLPTLYYLAREGGNGSLYLYWQVEDRYVPYQLLKPVDVEFVILPPPEDALLPDGFEPVTLGSEGNVYPAFRLDPALYRPFGSFREMDQAETESESAMLVIYASIVTMMDEDAIAADDTGEAAAEAASIEAGDFYFYDQTTGMLYPLKLMPIKLADDNP